ncbi:MAG: hypothetical protein ACT4TC_24015 [Myxococcaceae bacterium]
MRGVALLLVALGGVAQGAAFQIDARTEAQAYSFRSFRGVDPNNPLILPRRRIVQYLGLEAYELFTGQDLGFESSLRVYADLGLPRGEAAKIDGVGSEEADLLYATVKYRGKKIEAKLGRQLYVDIMDWMSFDGLKLRYISPIGLGAEIYGGLWVKSASFFASAVYQPDGIRDRDDRRIEASSPLADPAYNALEPVVGGKLLLEDLKGFSAAAGFRQSWVARRVSLQRGMAELRYGRGRGFNVFSAVDYDLYIGNLANGKVQVRYDADLFAVSVEALRFTPVLTSDSIWYYFAMSGRDEGRVRVDFTPPGPFRVYAQGSAGLYRTNLVNTSLGSLLLNGDASAVNAGGAVGASFRGGPFRSAVDLSYRAGYGGHQLWGDLTGGWSDPSRRWSVDLRFTAAQLQDSLNAQLRGLFLGGQLFGSHRFNDVARLSLVLEQNLNAFSRSDTKIFFLFDVKATL